MVAGLSKERPFRREKAAGHKIRATRPRSLLAALEQRGTGDAGVSGAGSQPLWRGAKGLTETRGD